MRKWMVIGLSLIAIIAGVVLKNIYEANREYQFANQIIESRAGQRRLLRLSVNHWFALRTEALEPIQSSMEKALIIQGVKHLRRSMAWNSYNRKAESLLLELGSESEMNGDDELALFIYSEMRSAYISTRKYPWNVSTKLKIINMRMSSIGEKIGRFPKGELLNFDEGQSQKEWKLLATVFAWTWVFSVFLFIFKSGFFQNQKKKKWGYFFASFIAMGLWIFMLAQAGT